MEWIMTYPCDIKKAAGVEFGCYFQLAMMVTGGKWKPKVLFHLGQNDVVRFGALRWASLLFFYWFEFNTNKGCDNNKRCRNDDHHDTQGRQMSP